MVKIAFSPIPILIALFAVVLLSFVNFYFIKRLKYRFAIYFQSSMDIALITVLVFYTGGITSPFYFSYIFPIIISAMFLSRKEAIYIATFSYIVFGVLCDLIYLRVIAYHPLMESISISLNVFIYNLVMSFIAFSSIAILSSFYFERIRKAGAELKNTQETLKDLVLLNNTVLEKMDNGFIISDSKGVIISYNERSKALLNLKSNSNIFDILSLIVDYRDSGKGTDLKVKNDTPQGSILLLNRKNYFEEEVNKRILGVSHSLIENIYSYKRIYVFIITDLTEKREIEKRLKQKERFALIGEMSAGIAHEIRNPLASISGSVQFLKKEMQLDDQPEYQHLMDIIIKESSRLSNSIEVFLDYTKTTP